jgi:predicted acylesterase/phospholipase RssA
LTSRGDWAFIDFIERNRWDRLVMPPVPVQIVFQGGGAKLCALMAVCEVLHAFEKEERITVTRLAGSSAGAIAAAMLGSRQPISDFKFNLRTIAADYLPFMNISKFRGAWRIYRGHPWFREIRLSEIFNKLFTNGPKTVGDLRPTTHICDRFI